MKRILIAMVFFIGSNQIAAAQTSGSHASNSPSVSSTAPKKAKGRKGQKTATGSLDNRKMYNWKDGQRATPTGHEATGTGGSAASLPKDSATVNSDSTRRQR